MGDRTPSQFYQGLKKLATSSTPDHFDLTFWRSRLPVHVQRVVATMENAKAETLTGMTDRVNEIRLETR
jgi:hypothetical protein